MTADETIEAAQALERQAIDCIESAIVRLQEAEDLFESKGFHLSALRPNGAIWQLEKVVRCLQ